MKKLSLPKLNADDFKINEKMRIDQSIYARWPQHVRAADDGEKTITIYQPIGEDFFGDGFTARRMAAALRLIGENDVVVSINSPGGDFFEGATIYNLLREHKGKVTVKIPGLAASAASIIAMAGDVINISKIGFYMIHNAWGVVIGNRNDMVEASKTFEKFDTAMADVYAARTGIDSDKIVKMMDSDTWLNGSEAVDIGFADGFLDSETVDDSQQSKDGNKKALARRTIEKALAKEGLSRKERENIFKSAIGVCDTTDPSVRDAGSKEELLSLLNAMR